MTGGAPDEFERQSSRCALCRGCMSRCGDGQLPSHACLIRVPWLLLSTWHCRCWPSLPFTG
jgi:hypothetical protein